MASIEPSIVGDQRLIEATKASTRDGDGGVFSIAAPSAASEACSELIGRCRDVDRASIFLIHAAHFPIQRR
ncbi:hypothetical protein [Candidatus Accumulibacter sp. ACC003]|uniref:hypothetical protein n=1 Tax=Candidatus Accumulibacter sp. ACC003 TaxID=2823334 RepID=UPI0025C5AC8B|nr:hypothetical protein [Candidatus Accumulibacter sp. ACC003]